MVDEKKLLEFLGNRGKKEAEIRAKFGSCPRKMLNELVDSGKLVKDLKPTMYRLNEPLRLGNVKTGFFNSEKKIVMTGEMRKRVNLALSTDKLTPLKIKTDPITGKQTIRESVQEQLERLEKERGENNDLRKLNELLTESKESKKEKLFGRLKFWKKKKADFAF